MTRLPEAFTPIDFDALNAVIEESRQLRRQRGPRNATTLEQKLRKNLGHMQTVTSAILAKKKRAGGRKADAGIRAKIDMMNVRTRHILGRSYTYGTRATER